MRFFLITFFLANSILFTACSAQKNTAYNNTSVSQPLLHGNTSALYKVSIKVFGDNFSGLLLFKHNTKEEAYNIVLLTEVGITLCEFYSQGDSMEVRNASSLFQSEMAQKVLAEDFSYLLHSPGAVKQLSEQKFKNREGIKYTMQNESELMQIRKKRFINGVIIDMEDYKEGIPSNIHIKHRGIKFSMNLKLLKVKE